VAADPQGRWIFVTDQLNRHYRELKTARGVVPRSET
jgi:hypothetical protein